jgi:hypothetical protein
MWTDPGNRHMIVEIGAEAAQFPEKEYINGIAVAVYNIRPCLYFLLVCIILVRCLFAGRKALCGKCSMLEMIKYQTGPCQFHLCLFIPFSHILDSKINALSA